MKRLILEEKGKKKKTRKKSFAVCIVKKDAVCVNHKNLKSTCKPCHFIMCYSDSLRDFY